MQMRSKSLQLQGTDMVKKNVFRSCDGNSGFFHDLISVEVSKLDGIVGFTIGFDAV